jgi:Protein of unknown function, DUF547
MRWASRGTSGRRRSRQSAAVLTALSLALMAGTASAGAIHDAFHRSTPGSAVVVDHAAWDDLLEAYVVRGEDGLDRVDYARWKRDAHLALKRYITRLSAVPVAKLDRAEQFAFWANLYNAKTIDIVLDHYPVASIKAIKLGGLFSSGPWGKPVVAIGGQDLSLDNIEHDILRAYFKDARVHYAVNCASIGCPNLGREALTGAKLDSQLDLAARAYVNGPRGVRIAVGRLTVSKIYSWFQQDFGSSDAGVLAHLRGYAEGPTAEVLGAADGIAAYEYDWRLNDTKNLRPAAR